MTYGMQRVRPRRVKKLNRLWVYLSVFWTTVFLLFYLSAHVFILSLEDSVRSLEDDREFIEDKVENLEIEVAGLRKGSRIIKIAQEDLGLEMPVGAPEKLF